jgi:hypothetical protein
LGRRIGRGVRAGISPHAIDHISLIKIAGNQNIIGIAVISFGASTPEGTQSSLKRPLAKRQHDKGHDPEHGRISLAEKTLPFVSSIPDTIPMSAIRKRRRDPWGGSNRRK